MYIFLVICGCVFLILDKCKNNKIYLVLSLSFLFGAILIHKYPNNNYIQIFSIPTCFFIFNLVISKIFERETEDKIKEENGNINIGKIATVTKDIGKTLSIDGIGQIEINNVFWLAKNITDTEIKAGSKVQIVSKENTIMNVRVI